MAVWYLFEHKVPVEKDNLESFSRVPRDLVLDLLKEAVDLKVVLAVITDLERLIRKDLSIDLGHLVDATVEKLH